MKKLVMGFVLLNFLAACASDAPPVAEETAAVEEVAPVVEVAPEEAPAAMAEPTPAAAVMVDPLNDANSLLSKRSVFYPFDADSVPSGDKAIIQAHAQYLADNPNRSVRVEGNADERGSSEYNLALGQRRANGVKKMLLLGGAKASQIESVSFGEEKPRATGHDESAWSQNRRTDIVYRK